MQLRFDNADVQIIERQPSDLSILIAAVGYLPHSLTFLVYKVKENSPNEVLFTYSFPDASKKSLQTYISRLLEPKTITTALSALTYKTPFHLHLINYLIKELASSNNSI